VQKLAQQVAKQDLVFQEHIGQSEEYKAALRGLTSIMQDRIKREDAEKAERTHLLGAVNLLVDAADRMAHEQRAMGNHLLMIDRKLDHRPGL
jgi:hypothetical protein